MASLAPALVALARRLPRLASLMRQRPRLERAFSSNQTLRPALALLTAATAATAAVTLAHAEPASDWHAVLDALHEAQQHHSSAPSFTAARRPLDRATWSYHLHFPAHPDADLLTLLITLSDALAPEATLSVHESPTRSVLTLSEPSFELELSIPRLAPFDTSVALRLNRPADHAFSDDELDALVRAYHLTRPVEPFGLLDGKHSVDVGPPTVLDRSRIPMHEHDPFATVAPRSPTKGNARRAKQKLEELGVQVFETNHTLSWDALAGYDDVKKRIDDTLTLPLKHPDVYQSIVRGTRKRYESNLPKAVLYEGPPGCGKTLSAKILAASIGVPFVHVPLETILSKFYGETTRKLAEILQTANELGRCLVFIDECDSIGMSRSSSTEIHEVTRRTLSILLRHIDGMDGPQNTILLAATNHKEDIDPALMSRFDIVVSFPLPDLDTRAAVLALYAKHLSDEELKTMAELSAGFSGRELLDVCEEAERTHGGEIVRRREKGEKGVDQGLPALHEYVEAIRRKAPHIVGRAWERGAAPKRDPKIQARTNGPAAAVAT